MSLGNRARTLRAVLRTGGVAGIFRRLRKSGRMRWHRWRGRRLSQKRGWRTKQPVLVIEADDWGAEHMSGPDASREMKRAGLAGVDACYSFDGLERPEDVDRLCEVLSAHRDADGTPAVMTVNFVVANPDYAVIEACGYEGFHSRPIDRGWNHEADSAGLWRSYRRAMDCGVFVPQLHGYLHFDPDEWLGRLREGDPATLKAFELRMIGEMEDADGVGIESMAPIYYGTAQETQRFVVKGLEVFERAFGRDSLTTIAPCYAWRSPETEEILLTHGIRCMQGKEFQYLPGGVPKLHYVGERGDSGMLYLTRTCLLEPIASGTTVEQCVTEIVNAFSLDLPAILCSHRINYTSRVAAHVRDKGLAVLDGVLKQVTSRFPNVEFLSSDQLASRIMEQTSSS